MNSTNCTEDLDASTVVIGDVERIIRIIIISSMLFLIFTTNGMIATVLYNTETLPGNTKYLIGSLCASDLLTGVLFITILVSAVCEYWVFGEAMCVLFSLISAFVMSITVLTLAMMITDKFLLLKYPLKYYSIMKRRTVTKMVIGGWFVAMIVIGVFAVLFDFHYQYSNSVYMCEVVFVSEEDKRNTAITAFAVALPIASLYFYCNIHIFWICQTQKNRINSHVDSVLGQNKSFNVKGLKTILIATVLTISSLLPFNVIKTSTWLNIMDPPPIILFLTYMCMYCTSFSNWIIYTKTHPPYRREQGKVWVKLKNYSQSISCLEP